MENKITLELTRGEVLMLQELTEDTECDYTWMQELCYSLRVKALKAYEKPVISKEEYQERIAFEKEFWQDEAVKNAMVRAKEHVLRFYYKLPEEV